MASSSKDWPYGPRKLTLGLELEFVVLPDEVGPEGRNMLTIHGVNRWVRAHYRLGEVLNEVIDDGVVCQPHMQGPRSLLVKREGGLGNFVGTRKSREDRDEDGEPWLGMEMNTSVFSSKDCKGRCHGLPNAVTQLLSAVRSEHDKMLVGLNTNCGLHVHAGYKYGLTLLLAQRIASLVLVLDPTLLFQLSSPTLRRENRYCREVGRWSIFAGRSRNPAPYAGEIVEIVDRLVTPDKVIGNTTSPYLWDTLHYIWMAQSLEELEHGLMDPSEGRCSIALCLRNPPLGKRKRTYSNDPYERSPSTIEFRHMQASADPDFLGNWLEVVCAIMQIAALPEGPFRLKFRSLVDLMILGEKMNDGELWRVMLHHLNLGHQENFWEKQRENYSQGILFPGTKDGVLMPGV